MIRFREEVRIAFVFPQLSDVLRAASIWSLLAMLDVCVRSINDGHDHHRPGSLHFYDLAIDLVVDGAELAESYKLAEYLRRVLPAAYQVAYRSGYVHVEWNPRSATLENFTG